MALVLQILSLLLLLLLYYFLPYLQNHALRKIPGPRIAAISNFWLLYQCRRGRRYKAVDEAHKKNGPLVRLQPHHVSVAEPEAIAVVYSHTGGWLKSEYYDAFVSIRRGLFNTRNRAEHTRKRKTISHTFSAKSISQFEPYIEYNLQNLINQWDTLTARWQSGRSEYSSVDTLQWFNYLAFDIIGDLAFGAPFGMLEKGADVAEVQSSPDVPANTAPAIQVLNRRGEVSATLGCYPALKAWAKWLPDPFFRKGINAVEALAGIAVARVGGRLKAEEEGKGMAEGRKDLLARLIEGKDEKGEKLGREELTAEALTQLIAGSDTTSNTSCAGLYWILRTESVQTKLQEELDDAIPKDVDVPHYEMVKDLPYLRNVINETLRIHSTSSLGLPRIVPPGAGVVLCGHLFQPGTVLSVPAYTMHHSHAIWNPIDQADFDPDAFNPNRWKPENLTELQKQCFIPFSTGPRACVGRNVAEMELVMIFATVMRRYEFILEEEGELETREGFLRKPLRCKVGIRKRSQATGSLKTLAS